MNCLDNNPQNILCRASQTLLCSGVPEDIARNAMRLSLGRNTTKEDIDIFIADLRETVKALKIVD